MSLKFDQKYFFLLESSLVGGKWGGRYTIAAWNPVKVIQSQSGGDFFKTLENELRASPVVQNSSLPFTGGWIGYLGYELYSELESKVPSREPDLLPAATFCRYDSFYVYDHLEQRAYFVGEKEHPLLCKEGEGGGRYLPHLNPPLTKGRKLGGMTKGAYLSSVQKIQEWIGAGDCYQVNFAQRFSCPVVDSPYAVYQRLRSLSPAPYAAFLNLGDTQILSSSPECFLQVNGSHVITRPIKGTRRRGNSPEEEARLIDELALSDKEKAELLMITDLERNDLGRVCQPGSIRVTSMREVESYAQVHHAVSTIEGELSKDKNIVDLLKAIFPGGSITGAPKVRAMQIIRELEPHSRNVYCGAIGFISDNGNAHFNVAIRTMVLKNQTAYFWGGGGIVADSDPEKEYEETLAKVEGMKLALAT